ncbi:MAG: PRC-barrel domain-containing protein [Planctomycetes bacterium]|nr:PRC-barrel domain-containing protein [Planctomycetota bacterium]
MRHTLLLSLFSGCAASLLPAQTPTPKADAPAVSAGSHMRGKPRCKASELIGLAITNSKNESLGEVLDIVLDGGNAKIAYAVVTFGGFLGMGEKYFAIPWRLLEIEQRSSEDPPRATLGLDRETLKSAPGFDHAQWPDMANPTWSAQVDEYYHSRNENPRTGGASEPKGSGADGEKGVDREPSSKGFVHRKLSKLIGMNVVDLQNVELADVEDLVVDTKTATVEGVLVSFGGILGFNEKVALLPFKSLTLDADRDTMVLPCSADNLALMALAGGTWPRLDNDEWLTKGRNLCAKARDEHEAKFGKPVAVEASASKSGACPDLYDISKVETVQGVIRTVGTVEVGTANQERVRLRIRTDEGREVIVYAAPASFAEQTALGLFPGKRVEVTGSPCQDGTQRVLVAGSLKVDKHVATLRDAEGNATWAKS